MANRRWVAVGVDGERLVAGDPHQVLRLPVVGVAPLLAAGHRDHHVVHAERVPRVVDPVVDLELDPGRGEQVQRRAGMKWSRASSCWLTEDRVGLVERLGPVVRPRLRPKAAPTAPISGAERSLSRPSYVRAERDSSDGERRHLTWARWRLAELGVDQVLPAQHVPEGLEVEHRGRARAAGTRAPPGSRPRTPRGRRRRGPRCVSGSRRASGCRRGRPRWRRRPPCGPG